MVNTPIVGAQRHADVSPRGFLVTLRIWMGRFLSTCGSISRHLDELISKSKRAAEPAFDKNHEKPIDHFSPKKGFKLNGADAPKKIPSPIHPNKPPKVDPSKNLSKDEILDPSEDDADESTSIVSSLFTNMGFDMVGQKIPAGCIIYSLQGEKQNHDVESLNGEFQVEWNLKHLKHDQLDKLIYKGGFQNGTFHGNGCCFTQDNNGSLHLILDGCFDKGLFFSGLLVMDDSYIEGTFNNGKKNGIGKIHAFPDAQSDEENDSFTIEYRGEFVNGKPQGEGKMYWLSSNGGMFIQQEGTYEEGMLVSGRSQEEDDIYKGSFTHTDEGVCFKGNVRNLKDNTFYEGDCLDGEFCGQGKLISLDEVYQDVLKEISADELVIKNMGVKIKITKTGNFENNEFNEGELKVEWADGKVAISNVEEGKIVDTVITGFEQYKFKGQFTLGTLDGKGVIYDLDDNEVYQGEIKCGYPHGKGKLISDDNIQEGLFEWGHFKGKDDQK